MGLRLPPFKWPLDQRQWELVYRKLTEAAALIWSQIDLTGSNLTDLVTRNHADLQNINTATYTHLSATNATDLTDSGASTLHYHTSDRDRANHTGTQTASTISDFTEAVEDVTGAMVSGNTETGIAVTYDDATGKLDFDATHNHTTADGTGPLTNDEHDGFVELATSATPSTPASGKMRIYAQDAAGVARLRAVHSTGSDLAFFRDSVRRVKNTSGVTINKGEIVYITGATGNFETVAKAKADSETTTPAAGMILATAADNTFATMQFIGEMTGLDTSAFSEGAIVYLSSTTAGALTATEPQHPYFSQQIGTITKANMGDGRIALFVGGAHEGDDYGTNRNTFKIGPNAEFTVDTGKVTEYNNIATEDYGLAAIVDGVHLSGQTADITTTNFTNAGAAGNYEVDYYLQDTAADLTAGMLTLTIAWTDDAGATTATATQALTAVGRTYGKFPVRMASGNITYSVTHTGIFGTSQYRLDLTVKRTL